ncbi:hypothetical protein FRZ06_11495 [Anoxybacterium hadale]|uniref:Uncharacterized protein n=1 Tax=Anoxybacterium hadale TaxID=3408580 RepID=A0ACD1ABN5_9FIRM|nr:hypothetical protein FRZ06_11495 [Clostridiales bacterium]
MGFFDVIFGKKNTEAPQKVERFSPSASTNLAKVDIPPVQGDYAKAIFLHAYHKSSSVKTDNEYAQYFLFECGIRNPSRYHRELITEGYLEKSSPKERIKGLKIPELKAILTELGQTTSGKKDDLIQRIFDIAGEDTMIKWPGFVLMNFDIIHIVF